MRNVRKSTLETFQDCPEKYRLRYIKNIKPVQTPAKLAFGIALHHALAEYYSRIVQKKPIKKAVNIVEILMNRFDDIDETGGINYTEKEDREHFQAIADFIVPYWFDNIAKQTDIKPVLIEHHFNFKSKHLPEGCFLTGTIDLVSGKPKHYILQDHKTKKGNVSETDITLYQYRYEVAIYAYACKVLLNEWPAAAVYNVFRKVKDPKRTKLPPVVQVEVPINVDLIKNRILEISDIVKTENYYFQNIGINNPWPRRRCPDCFWKCGFTELCFAPSEEELDDFLLKNPNEFTTETKGENGDEDEGE